MLFPRKKDTCKIIFNLWSIENFRKAIEIRNIIITQALRLTLKRVKDHKSLWSLKNFKWAGEIGNINITTMIQQHDLLVWFTTRVKSSLMTRRLPIGLNDNGISYYLSKLRTSNHKCGGWSNCKIITKRHDSAPHKAPPYWPSTTEVKTTVTGNYHDKSTTDHIGIIKYWIAKSLPHSPINDSQTK